MSRSNNFDFLRLLFASFVIISHSYPISGIKENDWLRQFSQNQISFSALGISGFFIISGFLIYQSLERSSSIFNYYWKRFLRLYPGLIVVLMLSIIGASLIYSGSSNYWKNNATWSYLYTNILLFKADAGIEGVFDFLPIKNVINGSLWTIPYELSMYLLLSILYFFRKQREVSAIILFIILGFLLGLRYTLGDDLGKFQLFSLNGIYFIDLGVYFFSGASLAKLEIWKWQNQKLKLGVISLLLVLSFGFQFFENVKYVLLPLSIILIGIQSTKVLTTYSHRVGDLSYGVYIYAFPVQQGLMYFFSLSCFQLMVSTWMITIPLAWLSWRFVESKALEYKKKPFFKKISAF